MKALNTYANSPRIYYRYVDDTIAAIKKTNIDDFHQHLNSLNTHIQFTIERYKDTGISFLDTSNFVEVDGSISTSVYRKETHSDRYLHFTIQSNIRGRLWRCCTIELRV